MQVFKRTIFCCVRSSRKNATIFAIFHNRRSFLSTSYFSSEKDPGAVKIVTHNLKSLFYLKLVKMLSSDKRQSQTCYTFL